MKKPTKPTLREDVSTFTLAPSGGDPELPGMAEWRAQQKRKASAELLFAELASLQGPKEGT